MAELERTIGQMIDHLGLKASYSSIGGGFECDGGRIAMLQRGRMDVYWGDDAIQFTSLEDALRWMCERKDNDFQIDAFEIYPDRSLRIYVHCGTGPKRFEGNFILSRAESPEWLPVEFKGTPRPTDEQFDDLVRDHEILGLICEQMWCITPKEEA